MVFSVRDRQASAAVQLGDGNRQTYHEVSDLHVTTDSDGDRLYLSGTPHCGEVAEGKDVFMTCVGYDTVGKPVCMFSTYVKTPASHSNVEFTMIAEVYGSVTAEDLADSFEVCATSSIPLGSTGE